MVYCLVELGPVCCLRILGERELSEGRREVVKCMIEFTPKSEFGEGRREIVHWLVEGVSKDKLREL